MWARVRSFLEALKRREHFEEGLNEELRFHVDAYADDLMREGVPRPEAYRQAKLQFGAVERVRDECRQARGVRVVDELRQDLSFAVRSFARRRSLTLLLLVTLVLGIGGTTSVFSLLYGIVLAPLAYDESDQLVRVWPSMSESVSKETFERVEAESESYASLAAWALRTFQLQESGRADIAEGPQVTADYFRALRANAAVGRLFEAGDDRHGPRYAVLSWGFWQQRFGGDDEVVGRELTIDGESFLVAGVVERGFQAPFGPFDLATTLLMEPDQEDYRNVGRLNVLARLAPGVAVNEANAELRAISQRWASEARIPQEWAESATVVSLHDSVVGTAQANLFQLFGAAVLIFLVVIANVVNLLLARALAREREIGLRSALGASRRRLVRQLLTETMFLVGAGGVLAVGLSAGLVRGLKAILPPTLPRLDQVGLVPEVLLAALGLTVVTGLVVGVAPALAIVRRERRTGLGGWARGAGPGHSRLRSALVVAEVTLAVVLLAGAGVLIKSFWFTVQVDPGFDVAGTEQFNLLPGQQSWATSAEIDDYYAQLQDRLRALPGVDAVATVLAIPMVRTGYDLPVWRGADPPIDGTLPPSTRWRPVSADYFQTAGVRLLAGRRFDEQDTAESEAVAVLNRSAVRRYYGPDAPLDAALGDIIASVGYRARVVGVVEDVKMLGLRQPPPEAFYEPLPQANRRVHRFGFLHNRSMLVRTDLPPEIVEPSLRAAVAGHDPLASIMGLEPMGRVIAASLAQSRAVMVLLAGFALMALILGAIGVYGVMGYTVTERSREMGVRLALGAEVSSVVGTVMGTGLKLVGFGVLLGGLLGVGLAGLLASELFEVEPADPLSFAVAAITIFAVATIAVLVPARRAGRIDPVDVLRSE